jgi:hypothetical protein
VPVLLLVVEQRLIRVQAVVQEVAVLAVLEEQEQAVLETPRQLHQHKAAQAAMVQLL